jgi:hypothetical protein
MMSNFDIKVVQKFNSYLVQNRLCLHQENKAVSNVVYECNVIFFLDVTRNHIKIMGLKISATTKQTVGVILGTQDLSVCGDTQLTCFKTEVQTAGTGCFQKFRHTVSRQLLRVYISWKNVPRFEPLHLFHELSPPACFSLLYLLYILG